MSRFATIIEAIEYKDLMVYTLKYVDEDRSEIEKFQDFCLSDERVQEASGVLTEWLDMIGNNGGAFDPNLFRGEGLAVALPPPRRTIEKGPFKDVFVNVQLRLYAYWISPSVIILFNGGVKRAQKAQDCPNVARHFHNSQRYTLQLDELRIKDSYRSIDNLEDLILRLED